jgi:hypothetical protein
MVAVSSKSGFVMGAIGYKQVNPKEKLFYYFVAMSQEQIPKRLIHPSSRPGQSRRISLCRTLRANVLTCIEPLLHDLLVWRSLLFYLA